MKAVLARTLVAFVASLTLCACADVPELAPDTAEDPATESVTDSSGDFDVESTAQALVLPGSFCWSPTYTREVATPVDTCPSGKVPDEGGGALCYDACVSGYHGVANYCWMNECPSGLIDAGTFCYRNVEDISADNSKCPWYDACGLTFAKGCSTCPAGYTNTGCTCHRDYYSIGKSYARDGGSAKTCASGKTEESAGLCYAPCGPHYSATSLTTCAANCPSDFPVPCAFGCATTAEQCIEVVKEQIGASILLAQNLAEIASAASTFFKAGINVARFSAYTAKLSVSAAERAALKSNIVSALKKTGRGISESGGSDIAERLLTSAYTHEAVDWSLVGLDGVFAVIDAFTKPMCHPDLLSFNVARGMPATQSSTAFDGDASRAVDGNTQGAWGAGSVTHTNNDAGAWWSVNLRGTWRIDSVVIWNRSDCCSERLADFSVELRDAQNRTVASRYVGGVAGGRTVVDFDGLTADSVVVRLNGTNALSLAEVEVMAY